MFASFMIAAGGSAKTLSIYMGHASVTITPRAGPTREVQQNGPALLRAVRAGEHPRIHPGQPVITIGATDELTVLRAYESGSNYHLLETTGYLLLRAVLASVLRRTVDRVTSRHLHVAGITSTWPPAPSKWTGRSCASARWSSSC